MSRSFEFASPIFGSAPMMSTRTFRSPDGLTTTVHETVRSSSGFSRPSAYEQVSPFSRTERISQPPTTRAESSSRGKGAGVVTSTSEYERDANGRPSHFSSTVYKSPYGKTHRFTSYY